ncbi:MAG: hypothetical protein J0H36_11545, partial [Hyphomicrobium denitrificans]|nr:hypothetical protein [Hyphomicrobium denitrificans]
MRQFVKRTRLLLRLLSMTFVLTVLGTNFALAHADHFPSESGFVNALAAGPIKELKIFGRSAYMGSVLSRIQALSHHRPTAQYVSASHHDPCSVNSTDRIQPAFFFTKSSTISPS